MTAVEQLLEMLPTVDPDLGALVRAELQKYRVDVSCGTRVDAIQTGTSIEHRLEVSAGGPDGEPLRFPADRVSCRSGLP